MSLLAKVNGKLTVFWGFLRHGQLDLLETEGQKDEDEIFPPTPVFRVCVLFLRVSRVLTPRLSHSRRSASSRADAGTAACQTRAITAPGR